MSQVWFGLKMQSVFLLIVLALVASGEQFVTKDELQVCGKFEKKLQPIGPLRWSKKTCTCIFCISSYFKDILEQFEAKLNLEQIKVNQEQAKRILELEETIFGFQTKTQLHHDEGNTREIMKTGFSGSPFNMFAISWFELR